MSAALLDINDSNLQLWHRDHHAQGPGYALLEGNTYRFGGPARAAARLQPRSVNTRYWWQLSTDALQPALGPARHTADLVHAHLQALYEEAGQPATMVLAAPASMQREQLALLLGIVQQCPFDAIGLVNRSVALGSLQDVSDRLWHLELQLHQAVLTELRRDGNMLRFHQSLPLPGCGMLQLQERLVDIIATAFIRQTRFDPRRNAATEQQLYDALPTLLQSLSRTRESNLDIKGYQARITVEELLGATDPLLASLPRTAGTQTMPHPVIGDPLLALLPGLRDRLEGLELLPEDALASAVAQHSTHWSAPGEALAFINALPCLAASRATPDQPSAPGDAQAPSSTASRQVTPAGNSPTHLLQNGRAQPLSAWDGRELVAQCTLQHDSKGWILTGETSAVLVNDSPAPSGQPLYSGDTLAWAGQHAQLIEVVP
tara:strand:+ start:89746 stop:91041 length:1296 start_codon:yes stop_codon:yes gene_type:complete